ncbi:MAG: protein kinase, partial [Oligoflexales bacterium]|nr:protein kinase [Oligoflexales bacterium]
MTLNLKDYQIGELLFESLKTVVYRGTRNSDGLKVMIKTIADPRPSKAEIAAYHHQYSIIKSIDSKYVIKALDIVNADYKPALILESFSDTNLADFIKTSPPLNLEYCLKIAIALVKALDEIHKKSVIHKDICPHNVLIDTQTGEVKIIDFSIAITLEREHMESNVKGFIEGSLQYMSPEQTGRMNRSLDYRTDFYSLGVTLYELLTLERPFTASDILGYVHAHIAVVPKPVNNLNPQIPEPLANVIGKLLEKSADDRYQSARGLLVDLQYCLQEIQQKNTISPFKPGLKDISERFEIPQKLYGREQQLKEITGLFDRVRGGGVEFLMVGGFSGIGKSSLISELYKSIITNKGFFIKGNFEQFSRDLPYTSLSQALSELSEQILS